MIKQNFWKDFFKSPKEIGRTTLFLIKSLPTIIPAIIRGDQVNFHIIKLPKSHNLVKEDGSVDEEAVAGLVLQNYEKE